MSTAVAYFPQENSQFFYGKPGTDSSSSKEPEHRPRSIRKLEIITNPTRIKEDLKLSWSGVVISMDGHELTVRMEDLTNRENPDELVVISRDEIDDRDLNLVKPGALFYWYIGYRQGAKCSKERFSIIRFRRLSKWTAEEIKEAENLAEDYANFFLTD